MWVSKAATARRSYRVWSGSRSRRPRPPVGTGAQRRQGGFRRRDQPPEPEGCPRLYPASHGRAERRAGSRVDLRLTLDEKKLAQYRAIAEKQAKEAAEERLQSDANMRIRWLRRVRTGGGRLRRGTAGRRACRQPETTKDFSTDGRRTLHRGGSRTRPGIGSHGRRTAREPGCMSTLRS